MSLKIFFFPFLFQHTEFVNRFYYPGQQLRGVMGDLRDVEWIHSTHLYNKTTANNKQRMNVIVVVEEVHKL